MPVGLLRTALSLPLDVPTAVPSPAAASGLGDLVVIQLPGPTTRRRLAGSLAWRNARSAFGMVPGPPPLPEAIPDPAGGDARTPNGFEIKGTAQGYNGERDAPEKVLKFMTSDGNTTVMLSGDSNEDCTFSCENAPELGGNHDPAAASPQEIAMRPRHPSLDGTTQPGAREAPNEEELAAIKNPAPLVKECIRFCNLTFKPLPGTVEAASFFAGMKNGLSSFADTVKQKVGCFPGDASVIVRGRGRARLDELQLSDLVLAGTPSDGRGDAELELRFEPLLGWLHRDASAVAEMVLIHHTLGKVSLTGDHLMFVLRARHSTGGCEEEEGYDRSSREVKPSLCALCAREVRVGDRLFSLWLDGSLAQPEVLSIERVQRQGFYAPLLACGGIVVDGTAVSCYAMPEDISDAHAQWPRHLISRYGAHTLAHLVHLPLRVALAQAVTARTAHVDRWKAATGSCGAVASDASRQSAELPDQVGIHPYSQAVYALASTLVH